MKIIYTGKMEEILVDDEDYEEMNQYTWSVNNGYAKRNALIGDEAGTQLLMHRMIMCVKEGDATDHVDRNRINNQRSNLRICSWGENARNRKIIDRNTSGVPGVSWLKLNQKWVAYINLNKKRIHLGLYAKFEDAVKIRQDAEIKYFGEFQAKNLNIDKENIKKSIAKKIIEKHPIDKKPRKNNTSGITGITWNKKAQKWKSYIRVNNEVVYLGCYFTLEEAKQVRADAELKYYGETSEDNNIEQC